jgi:hypothetical protein
MGAVFVRGDFNGGLLSMLLFENSLNIKQVAFVILPDGNTRTHHFSSPAYWLMKHGPKAGR